MIFTNLLFRSVPIFSTIVSSVGFYIVYRSMQFLKIEKPPLVAYSILFSILSGVLVILFGDFGRDFSFFGFILGLIEGIYTLYFAPFLTMALVFTLYPKRKFSGFHSAAFIASAVYTGMILVIFIGWLSVRLFVKPMVVN